MKKLLSDFDIKVQPETINSDDNKIELIIKNIRDYSLQSVVLSSQDQDYIIGDFKSNEEKKIIVDLKINNKNPNILNLELHYTSHSGLSGASQVELHLPILKDIPLILNSDFINEKNDNEKISGKILSSNILDLVIPENWINFDVNGLLYSRSKSRMEIPISNPYHSVSEPEISNDGINWFQLLENYQPGSGQSPGRGDDY